MTDSRNPRRARQALSYRNYRLFISGALISNSGVWVQMIALAFVIERLTGSATWVGLAAMLQTLPAVFLGMVGGALADRFPRRIMLAITNTAQALIALGFSAMWAAGVDRPLAYIALGVVNGCVNGIQLPAWQAFVSELVPRAALLNAVTLNSAQFNASRAVGPMIGGFVLAIGGPGWCFFTNSLTYVPAVFALVFIQVPRLAPEGGDRPNVFRDAAAAMRYAADNPGIRLSILIAGVIAFFGQPVIHLVVIFANDVFKVGETQYGILAAATGIGAMLNTPFVAGRGSRVPRSRLVGFGWPIYGIALLGFAFSPYYWLAVVALAALGASHIATAATLNTVIQLQVEEALRAKVLALYLITLLAGLPLGAQLQGALSDLIGPRIAVGGAGMLLAATALWWVLSGRTKVLDQN
ncbi:MAG: MFS transporter [Acidimicrobiia bacterium]|nr:MFS transporter [bacterium]MXW57268.1 MFS transporter [Acidimicrobiia bacterium]MXZ76895.1 MFS transporter [Acidimicrobiia bacterium]MXZ84289.1 MFS transporter [Acidimicrobiia bacterium]MYB09718.1 MFS transporter [Acidimicrobiia bacterium]